MRVMKSACIRGQSSVQCKLDREDTSCIVLDDVQDVESIGGHRGIVSIDGLDFSRS